MSNNRGAYYQFEPNRRGEVAQEMLRGYDEGVVVTDGFSGYGFLDDLENIKHAFCWSHVLRKFVDALSFDESARPVVGWIDELYDIEHEEDTLEGLLILRKKKSVPLVAKIDDWMDAMEGHYLDSTTLGKAINYYNDRFSRVNWETILTESGGSTSTVAGEFFQHLLDNDKLESKSVSVEDETTGTSYVPKKAITLDDFTSTQQSTLKTNLTQLMGASSPLSDTAINIILGQIFNLYCVLDSDIGPTIPYFNYFTLPGNERYYKVSKKHLDTKVDFFVLNITSTFNSETANEQDGVVVESVQHQWFVRETTNSDADFKIVLVHDEPHGSFESNPVTKSWNLEQYVDVVMSGDVQVYERSLITTDFGKAFFLSVGVGGLTLENTTPQENSASQSIVKEYGALFMQINSGQLDFEFKDKYGKTRDTFTLKNESLRKFVGDR